LDLLIRKGFHQRENESTRKEMIVKDSLGAVEVGYTIWRYDIV
jgi:hypothetical protein